ncbi:MAG: hypothetical protein ACXVBO_10255, partial [Isosphaeraceae bacterium]
VPSKHSDGRKATVLDHQSYDRTGEVMRNSARKFDGGVLVLHRHIRQLSMVQVIIFQELKSFLRISIRTWLMDQNPCETSHFLAIGVLTSGDAFSAP